MTGALSRTLGPPETWAEELCMLRNPDLISDDAGYTGSIVLSYPEKHLGEWEVDLDDVRADFESGVRIRRGRPHSHGQRFWLEGDRYEAEVLSKLADGERWPIAFVLRLARTPEIAVPRRSGKISCPVDFHNVREEQYCDIAALYQHVQRQERYSAARASADRVVQRAHRDRRLIRHDELHGLARKRYGALRALMSLLALRAERSAVTAEGVIISSDDEDASDTPYLYVRIGECDGALSEFNDAYLEISGPARQVRTRARDLSGQVIALDMPRNGRWESGSPVSLTTVPRFSMKQHDMALARFLRGEVEGDWDDLAALLCKPSVLSLPSRPLPPRFFCDEDPDEDPLNEAQRQAVAGALATPHAFVIQGPPGTGKTTVICEIVRQLISRGQRVLMLAPQHVAVDEVLRRIGRKPGIRALRLSWDESKVDERLRAFLPDRVGAEFVGALRRPGPDSDEHWAARRAGLIAEVDAIDRLISAQQRRYEAGDELAEAEAAHDNARRQLDEARAWLERNSEQRQAEIVAARQAFTETEQAAELAKLAESDAWTAFSTHRQPVDDLAAALEDLRDADGELAQATTAKAESEREHTRYRQNWAAVVDRVDRAIAASEEPWHNATRAASAARDRLQMAVARLNELPGRHRIGQRLVDRLGIGTGARREADAERARLEWVEYDQERQRWEAQRRRWITERQRLSSDSTLHQFAAQVAFTQERLQAATGNRQRASERWRNAIRAASGEILPEPQHPDAVLAVLRAVISDPAEARPLPAQLAPAEFREAHDRLRATVATLRQRTADMATAQAGLASAEQAFRDTAESGQAEQSRLEAEVSGATARVRECQTELERATRELGDPMITLGYSEPPDPTELANRREQLTRKIRVLPQYSQLRGRWLELVSDVSDDQLAADTGDALLRSVNLVCATTTGISGRSADSVRQTDFDTLIVDEASRVIDSEFLIGAVRARHWLLVGDEHQLPPYVDQNDEYLLHALASLYRLERGDADSLEAAVQHLAKLWREEDDEQRRFRETAVCKKAAELRDRGEWPGMYLEAFADARKYFSGADPDREFLRAMLDHLVKSLLERVTASSQRSLREPLIIQRRMIEPMAEIVRVPVYKGRYETPPAQELRRYGVSPLVTHTFDHPITFLNTSARGKEKQVGNGFINKLEIEWIANACRIYERELITGDEVTVSVLCFYLAQALEIRKRLKAPRYPGYRRLKFERIDPIDKIQGQQSDIVFISFCRSNPHPSKNFGQWLQDLRRLNVACTRARRSLVLVGNWDMLGRLHTFDDARNFYTNLLSLFDPASEDFLRVDDF